MKTLHSPIDYKGKHIEGEVSSLNGKKVQGLPFVHQLIIDDKDWVDQLQRRKMVGRADQRF